MSRTSTARIGVAVAGLLLLMVAGAARAQAPGKLTVHARTAAPGAGFAWGSGTLEFEGKTYPVRVDGVVIGAVGVNEIDASGEVTGLTKAEDLNGDFTAMSGGLTVGPKGQGVLVMRNNKGVRVELQGSSTGLQIGAGLRGITLSVGEAGGPPAEAGALLPQTLGFGEFNLGPLYLRPTLNAQVFLQGAHNPGFNGDWSFGPVDQSEGYFEHSNEEGLNARLPLGAEGEYGTLEGRASGVFSMTTSAPDMPVCVTKGSVSDYTLESLYLGYKSGDLFPKLGSNAIELIGGNHNYQVFDGLLFWDGGQDCAGRGANWLSPRKAFQGVGIARLNLKDLTLETVHLKYNDHPNTHTNLWAERIEFTKDDWLLKHLKLGFMYFHIYRSDNPARDGMNGYYAYSESNPFDFLPDFSFRATYVRETNSESSGLSAAYAWYVAPAYQLSNAPWTPTLSYRYAFFSGGGTNAFDSLFTGLPDWGYWFQGEVLGEAVLSNSNLISHQFRVKAAPNDWLTFNLIYYRFLLQNANQGFSVTPRTVSSRALADEVDLTTDITMTNWWSISLVATMANPNKGFTQAVNGSATWFTGYVYMSFNF
ncbi:MAG TPA: alginate export family protein [Myxococcota bacterium]|nr:alginate export family protein [Myxococcota bacterium]